MDKLEIAMIIIGVLWSLLGVLIGIIWNDNKAKMKALELRYSNIDHRVQKVEDIQGTAIEKLEKSFEKLENKFDILTEKVNELRTSMIATSTNETRILDILEKFNTK